LDTFTTTTRNVPERHRSIKAAFEHSWKLLTPKEQRVLRKLSVFQGGFRREAASEVADATIPLLVALVDKSMLRVSHDGRYDFHPLLYRYTGEKLDANPNEQNLTRERHAAYLFALAEEAGPHLHDSAQTDWLGRLEEELGNLRAALAWAEERHYAARCLQLAVTLGEFCRTRGFLTEGRTLLHGALTQPGAAERTQVRARTLTCAGALAWMQSDYTPATSLHEESLSISRELGDKEGIAASLHNLGRVRVEQGDYRLARSHFEESLAIDRSLESWCGIANTLHGLGWVVLGLGDLSLARSLYEESLALGRRIGNRLRVSDALHGLGHVTSYQGDLPLARRFYEESLAISRELGDKWNMVNTLNKLGLLIIEQGDHFSARSLLEESMVIAQEIGDGWGMICTLESFASLAAATGDSGGPRVFGALPRHSARSWALPSRRTTAHVINATWPLRAPSSRKPLIEPNV
jgi:tetratricopeptide (TPR) repeat protein